MGRQSNRETENNDFGWHPDDRKRGPCSSQKEKLFSRHSNYLSAYSFMKYIASWKLNWQLERGKKKYLCLTVSFLETNIYSAQQ